MPHPGWPVIDYAPQTPERHRPMHMTREQLSVLRDHIAANPDHTATEVGDYFGRVADLDTLEIATITSAAGYLLAGDEDAAAGYLDPAERQAGAAGD